MEEYLTTSRFILTCNYPKQDYSHYIVDVRSTERIDQTEFTARVAEILIAEEITPDIDTLDTYVKATYPDLRKCINMVQMNSVSGELLLLKKAMLVKVIGNLR